MEPTPDQGRWGILGGTFDPVHRGHLVVAEDVRRFKRLDGIFLVPSVHHPFKMQRCHASYHDRLQMLKLAISNRSEFQVSCIESTESLSGYTLDTVRALKNRYPRTQFFFIIGADLLGELGLWHRPQQILKEVTLLVVSRPSYNWASPSGYPPGAIELIPTTSVNVSSTMVRRCVRENADDKELDRLIPAQVRRYIRERGLYR